MSHEQHDSDVVLRQEQGFRFAVDFGHGVPWMEVDEAPPLSAGNGPTPLQLLAAAVGNCLSDSLYFALKKFGQEAPGITTRASPAVGRNAEGRMRVQHIDVELRLGVPAASITHLDRILGQFENFCTVAESIRAAVPINVSVFDANGVKLK